MPKVDALLMQAIKLLSMRVAMIEPFYNSTACMNREEREIFGYAAAYIEIFGENDPLSQILKHLFMPAIKKIGIAKWPRLELTDLGFAISNKDSREEDISGEEPMPIEHVIKDMEEALSDNEPGT